MKKTISIFVAALAPFALAMAEKPAEGGKPGDGDKKGGGGKDPGAMIDKMVDKMFEAADTDENGSISLEEWKNKPERQGKKPGGAGKEAPDPEVIFNKIDADADGEITKEEAKTSMEERMKNKGGGKGGGKGGPGKGGDKGGKGDAPKK